MTPFERSILLVLANVQVRELFDRILRSAGHPVICAGSLEDARSVLARKVPSLALIGAQVGSESGLDLAAEMADRLPHVPLLLYAEYETVDLLKQAMRLGLRECITLPASSESVLSAVDRALAQSDKVQDYVRVETGRLKQRLDELETLSQLGRAIISSLDLDAILRSVVDAAVDQTGAEEGSLLLVDESTGELYVRAARNFNEDFVRTFRLPIQDSLAGSVIQSGHPIVLDQTSPEKITTSYLVRSLAYVPLRLENRVIGVLGVDNRIVDRPLQGRQLTLLSAIADLAVLAIQNAQLYDVSQQERAKLETILEHVQDGVIAFDQEQRLLLMNEVACQAFQPLGKDLTGRPAKEVLTHLELLALLEKTDPKLARRTEVTSDDGRTFDVQLANVPDVGPAITLHDVTNLKKLDRIKSDFVSTVSHDLRSPLTAILGYVELIERVGPINDVQRDFIRRVQISVQNITSLVDDLVNLGRIEAGFDSRKEQVRLDQIARMVAESMRKRIEQKNLQYVHVMPEALPPVLGNPIQLRQMIEHLLDNAIKYVPAEGRVGMRAEVTQNQVIFQVSDNGVGITPVDLPYVFDKFYRGSNVASETSGTGLGLAIVRSIVENHAGRIWVDSSPGKGSTFTIVLPLETQS